MRSLVIGKSRLFCNRGCQFGRSVLDRFLSFIGGSNEKGCWLWTGHRKEFGYGTLKVGAKSEIAHRVSWLIFRGDIPGHLFVCHRCDVPECVNPEHLFLGTNADNMRDMKLKGRHVVARHGSLHHNAKMTEEDVRDLRTMYWDGTELHVLADYYGVTTSTARKAAWRQHWKHVL